MHSRQPLSRMLSPVIKNIAASRDLIMSRGSVARWHNPVSFLGLDLSKLRGAEGYNL